MIYLPMWGRCGKRYPGGVDFFLPVALITIAK